MREAPVLPLNGRTSDGLALSLAEGDLGALIQIAG